MLVRAKHQQPQDDNLPYSASDWLWAEGSWVGAWHDQSQKRGVACTELTPWTPPSSGRHSMMFFTGAGHLSRVSVIHASLTRVAYVPSQDLMWINRPSNLTVAWQRSSFPQNEWLEVALDLMKRVRSLIRVSNVKKMCLEFGSSSSSSVQISKFKAFWCGGRGFSLSILKCLWKWAFQVKNFFESLLLSFYWGTSWESSWNCRVVTEKDGWWALLIGTVCIGKHWETQKP